MPASAFGAIAGPRKRDYVLIILYITKDNTKVYLEPFDKKLFNKLDSQSPYYEYEHWILDMTHLSLGTEIHDVKIIMVRKLSCESREIILDFFQETLG